MHKVENIVKYQDIGEVRYVNSSRAKNLSIRINQKGEVRVTIPRRVSRRKAELFLESKKQWIQTKLGQLKSVSGNGRMLNVGDVVYVRGKAIPIQLEKGEENVEDTIWRILHKEASAYLPDRVRELAAVHGFKISGVKIRKMKTRWGSCSVKNSINLNSWLMMLPEHLSDYVILHELVHTKHRDHSKKFWNALDSLINGSSKILRKELRNQRIMSF
jgi:predicted metal-dependent hydrolase